MTWLSIILWLLTNLPTLIEFINKLFGRTKVMQVAEAESLRLELSSIIQSKRFTRKEKRLLCKQILLREESKAVAESVALLLG